MITHIGGQTLVKANVESQIEHLRGKKYFLTKKPTASFTRGLITDQLKAVYSTETVQMPFYMGISLVEFGDAYMSVLDVVGNEKKMKDVLGLKYDDEELEYILAWAYKYCPQATVISLYLQYAPINLEMHSNNNDVFRIMALDNLKLGQGSPVLISEKDDERVLMMKKKREIYELEKKIDVYLENVKLLLNKMEGIVIDVIMAYIRLTDWDPECVAKSYGIK